MDTLVGKDLRLELPAMPDGSPPQSALGVALAALETAVRRSWPAAAWSRQSGPDTLPRSLAGLVGRMDMHVPGPDSTDRFHAPLGALLATVGGHTIAWLAIVHVEHRGPWHLMIEPRLRRRWLGLFNSDRIPGSRELDPALAAAMTAILRAVADGAGQRAVVVPGNTHYVQDSILVLPG